MSDDKPADVAADMRFLLASVKGAAMALAAVSLLRLMLALSDGWWPAALYLFGAVAWGGIAWVARRKAERYDGLSVTFVFPHGPTVTREKR